jgi:hypothetical protein
MEALEKKKLLLMAQKMKMSLIFKQELASVSLLEMRIQTQS